MSEQHEISTCFSVGCVDQVEKADKDRGVHLQSAVVGAGFMMSIMIRRCSHKFPAQENE